MKKSKKIFFGIIAFFVVVFVAFTVYMRVSVNVEYSLQALGYDTSAFTEYENDKDLLLNHFKSCYGISEKRIEEMRRHENEWVKVELNYEVKNTSRIPIIVVVPISTNRNDIFVCREEQVNFFIGEVGSGDSGIFHTDIIIKKEELSEKTLNNLKLKIFALPVSFKAEFSGFPSLEYFAYDETEAVGKFENGTVSYFNLVWDKVTWDNDAEKAEAVSEFTEGFLDDYAYYLPANQALKLNNNSIAICRFFPNGFYNAHKFKCNGKEYVGFSFFDDNMDFMGGMALNALRGDKDMFENLEIGKAVFEDVKALDSACIVFKDGENFKSCHYFADKTCIEFTYSADGVITSKSEPDVEKLFDLLIDSDVEYIENL